MTVAYSCRFRLGVLGGYTKREAFRGERDGRVVIILGMLVLVVPSVIGGWGLSGTIPRNNLIFLRRWIKLSILIIIIISAGLILRAGKLTVKPAGLIPRFTHQIWFMPLLFRPELTRQGLAYSNVSVKTRDRR